MDFKVTLIFLYFGFCIFSFPHSLFRQFHYVNLEMTYDNAQHYCREKYTDLATFESMEDIRILIRPTLNNPFAWIGLVDNPDFWKGTMGKGSNSWRWSATGETSKTGYEAWKSDEPNNIHIQYCVVMDSQSTWSDNGCGAMNQFVCYSETNQSETSYVFIPTRLRWPDARDYCREHHTDLAVIESDEENTKVSQAKPQRAVVWIGLYRTPWTWSDKSDSSFRNWKKGSPDNNDIIEFCVCENEQHEWEDRPCSSKLSFICHQDPAVRMTMRMKIETDADMTDPATNTQMLQQLGAKLSSQGWTDFKLRWQIQPRKQEKEKLTKTHCISHY